MVGVANAFASWRVVTVFSRSYIAIALIGFAVLLAAMFRDYRLIEIDLTAHRMVAARIAGAEKPEPPQVLVLGFLQEALQKLRTEPRREMGDDELEQFRLTVSRYPVAGGLFRYAQSAALNHRPEEASWALRVICNLKSAEVCAASIRDWNILVLEGNPEMRVVPMPKI